MKSYQSMIKKLSAHNKRARQLQLTSELAEVATALLDYIDAIPKDAEQSWPAMPGVDRDWVDNVLAKHKNTKKTCPPMSEDALRENDLSP